MDAGGGGGARGPRCGLMLQSLARAQTQARKQANAPACTSRRFPNHLILSELGIGGRWWPEGARGRGEGSAASVCRGVADYRRFLLHDKDGGGGGEKKKMV